MVTQDMLVVVVVSDPGLRALLTARLSLGGYPLVTAGAPSRDFLDNLFLLDPAVLVVDEADIPGDADAWIAEVHADGRWLRLAVLTLTTDDVEHFPWGARIPHAQRGAVLDEILGRWRELSRK